ncbi:MAG: efflux transporter periplasmic adaptor subunit [Phycisphaeraceae bacterium]|nr:efflux transporter periplasmic adaptor subunit [Phycisphaeraceae bacterium]
MKRDSGVSMTSTEPLDRPPTRATRYAGLRRWWWLPAGLLALVVVGVAIAAVSGGSPDIASVSSPDSDAAWFTVERGPLTISVVTAGSIQSLDALVIKNEVEGRTTVLKLVEEGTQAKAGDVLIELDSSQFDDDRIEQEIRVQNAHAALVQATQKLAVVREEAKVDIDAATVDLELARLDFEKYTADQGEYRQELRRAETKITIAEARLERAEDKLEWSRKLETEGYITGSQLKADALAHQEAQVEVELARNDKRLLEQFTLKRQTAALTSALRQKEFALTKTRHLAKSKQVDAEVEERARLLTHQREKQRLEKLVTQIAKCTIKAPVDGMVVYASSTQSSFRDMDLLIEGAEVRQHQELIRLPTAGKLQADVKIHESMLNRVRVGLAVRIETDVISGVVFNGRVSKIATLPDAQNRWLNPDLKVYNCTIELDADTEGLRPGSSCRAEIVTEHHEEALFVPVQAVRRVDGVPVVYVRSGSAARARQIEVGRNNSVMIHVTKGLEEAERVLLSPPMGAGGK